MSRVAWRRSLGYLGVVATTVVATVVGLAAPASATVTLQAATASIVSTGLPGAWGVDSAGGSAASGLAKLANNQATQAGMKGRVGSVTKEFVAAVALQLVAEGQMTLDDTVEQWVPNLLPYGSSVTIRQLLNHTSGIPDYFESGNTPLVVQFYRSRFATIGGVTNPDYDPAFIYTTWTPQQLVARVAGEQRHVLPPNEAEYSDTNFIVLGLVLQSVTGQTVQQLVCSRVITPLGLVHTSFPTTSTVIPGLHAHGYSYALDTDGVPVVTDRGDFTHYNPSILGAMGAIISSPADLNAFQRAFIGNQIPGHTLPAALVAQMKTTTPITLPAGLFPAGFGAGLGVWSWDLGVTLDSLGVPNTCGSTRVWGHEGEAPGYDTWSFANEAGTRAVSMFVNQVAPEWESQYYAVGGELPQYAQVWC